LTLKLLFISEIRKSIRGLDRLYITPTLEARALQKDTVKAVTIETFNRV